MEPDCKNFFYSVKLLNGNNVVAFALFENNYSAIEFMKHWFEHHYVSEVYMEQHFREEGFLNEFDL